MKPLTHRQIVKRAAKGRDFAEALLNYAEMRELDLFGGNFFKASLEGANLEGANLHRANFLAANLEGANLIDSQMAEVYGEEANFFRADMENCDLFHAILRNSNLREANLRNVLLEGADMENAQAASANLCDANVSRADLTAINLSYAQCRRARFSHSMMQNALLAYGDFRECDFQGANLEGCDFENADIRHANFLGARLNGALFDGCTIDGTLFPGGDFPELSARWFDLSENADGSERFECDHQSFASMIDNRRVISFSFSGALVPSAMLGMSHFFLIMQKVLPDVTIRLMRLEQRINRIECDVRIEGGKSGSPLTVCLFLIYQFSNSTHIDCSALEKLLIQFNAPLLAGVLKKKRHLTSEILKQILRVKKVMKTEGPFFKGTLYRFLFRSESGDILILKPVKVHQPECTHFLELNQANVMNLDSYSDGL